MKVRWFQHVEFEGLGLIEPWLRARGHELSSTRWWAGERATAAEIADCDWLVVMGGPMNIYQYRDHPWLPAEKAAIAAAIHAGKRVLGICLGAQLIADVLGGKVVQNAEREIGWWPLRPVPTHEARAEFQALPGSPVDRGAAERFALPGGLVEPVVLHWHGDTFALPPGAVGLAESAACRRQAFAWGARVLALQFHLEMDEVAVARICEACAAELAAGGRWVQSAERIARGARIHGEEAAALLDRWLGALAAD